MDLSDHTLQNGLRSFHLQYEVGNVESIFPLFRGSVLLQIVEEFDGNSHSLHCGNSGRPIIGGSQIGKEHDVPAFEHAEILLSETAVLPTRSDPQILCR